MNVEEIKKSYKNQKKIIFVIGLCIFILGILFGFALKSDLVNKSSGELIVPDNACIVYQPNIPNMFILGNVPQEKCMSGNQQALEVQYLKLSKKSRFLQLE